MRKIFFVLILLVVAVGIKWQFGGTFDAEKIVENSRFKDRTFKGEVVEVSALEGSVKAYLMEEHSVPLAVISFGFDRAGSAYEPKEGVALLTESVLLDGAGSYSRKELRQLMAEKGIKLSVSSNVDRLEFALSFVKKFENEALEVLQAVLYQPQLKLEDLDMARSQLKAARHTQKESPQYYLGKLIDDTFYKDHPYGKENIPSDEVLGAIRASDIRDYLAKFMARDALKIGVAGDMSVKETEAFLEKAFAGLKPTGKGADLPVFEPDFNNKKEVVEVDFSEQSYVSLVARGIKRLDEDFYPLYIANYIFGGSGLNSRISQAVREKEGLTYGIYSGFSNSDAIDLWRIYFSATPDNVAEVLKIARKEYADFYEKGVTAEELERAKKGLLNSFNLRFSSLTDIAGMLKQMQVQRLGIDFLKTRQAQVKAVSLEAVNRAIKEKMPKTLDETGGVRIFEAKGQKK